MRVVLSVDMEGVSQLVEPNEILACCDEYWATGKPWLEADVAAACRGLLAGGADEVVVLDNHASGNTYNVWPDAPLGARLEEGTSSISPRTASTRCSRSATTRGATSTASSLTRTCPVCGCGRARSRSRRATVGPGRRAYRCSGSSATTVTPRRSAAGGHAVPRRAGVTRSRRRDARVRGAGGRDRGDRAVRTGLRPRARRDRTRHTAPRRHVRREHAEREGRGGGDGGRRLDPRRRRRVRSRARSWSDARVPLAAAMNAAIAPFSLLAGRSRPPRRRRPPIRRRRGSSPRGSGRGLRRRSRRGSPSRRRRSETRPATARCRQA